MSRDYYIEYLQLWNMFVKSNKFNEDDTEVKMLGIMVEEIRDGERPWGIEEKLKRLKAVMA